MAAGKLPAALMMVAAGKPQYAPFHNIPPMPAPIMACSAFALELYLKCLIRMERKPFSREHDLAKLFAALGKRNRAKIKRVWRANSETVRKYVEEQYKSEGETPPKVTFDFALNASRGAFQAFRYLHEFGVASNTGWLGDAILMAARHVILSKHPDWQGKQQASHLPQTTWQRATFPTL